MKGKRGKERVQGAEDSVCRPHTDPRGESSRGGLGQSQVAHASILFLQLQAQTVGLYMIYKDDFHFISSFLLQTFSTNFLW